jgi:large subunit ribosomal protein L17
MKHRVGGRRFGRPTDQRLAMYKNLITDVLRYEKVITTEAKAKEIQGMVEKMITLARGGTIHDRRLAAGRLTDPLIVEKLFTTLAPRYAGREGGYTRVIKLEPRLGDNAPRAMIMLVEEPEAAETPAQAKDKK